MIENFSDLSVNVIVTSISQGSYIDGEWVTGSTTNHNVEMVPMPMTPQALRYLPDGVYDTQDIRFYMSGSSLWKSQDVISYNGQSYQIRDISDRSAAGGFTIYYAKRIK